MLAFCNGIKVGNFWVDIQPDRPLTWINSGNLNPRLPTLRLSYGNAKSWPQTSTSWAYVVPITWAEFLSLLRSSKFGENSDYLVWEPISQPMIGNGTLSHIFQIDCWILSESELLFADGYSSQSKALTRYLHSTIFYLLWCVIYRQLLENFWCKVPSAWIIPFHWGYSR